MISLDTLSHFNSDVISHVAVQSLTIPQESLGQSMKGCTRRGTKKPHSIGGVSHMELRIQLNIFCVLITIFQPSNVSFQYSSIQEFLSCHIIAWLSPIQIPTQHVLCFFRGVRPLLHSGNYNPSSPFIHFPSSIPEHKFLPLDNNKPTNPPHWPGSNQLCPTKHLQNEALIHPTSVLQSGKRGLPAPNRHFDQFVLHKEEGKGTYSTSCIDRRTILPLSVRINWK